MIKTHDDIIKTLSALGIQTNANEVMHTGNTNAGAELVPGAQLSEEIIDMIPEFGSFLGALPGNHGNNMLKSQEVSIIGDIGLFKKHTEKTTGVFAMKQGGNKLVTDKVTINQKQLDLRVDVSNELSNYNKWGEVKFQQMLKEKIAKSAARTIEHMILNGDTTNAGTGNINSDDADPADDLAYLLFDGLRKVAIDNISTQGVNAGTLDFGDYTDVRAKLKKYARNPKDVLFFLNTETYHKSLNITEFKDAALNGQGSTIFKGAITNILGSDLFTPYDFELTEADGKLSATPASNTKGQFLALWKYAVQYGFGNPFKMKLYDWGADGYQLEAWFDFGFVVLDDEANNANPTVAVGYNITV